MKPGYILLWRKFQDNFLWKEPRKFSRAEAWIDILMEARGKPEPENVVIGNRVLTCNRGEVLYSLDTWAKRWGWDKSSTRRFLNLLQKIGQIRHANETVTTRIKIIKYDTYCPLRNANDTELNSERNASETQVTPTNKVNKDNKYIKSPAKADSQSKKTDNASEYLYNENIFPKVHAFVNKMRKTKKNEQAIYHALERVYHKWQQDQSIDPWPYAMKVIQIEDGNYNERDYQKKYADLQKQAREMERKYG